MTYTGKRPENEDEVKPMNRVILGLMTMTAGMAFIMMWYPQDLAFDVDTVINLHFTIIGGSFVLMGIWAVVKGFREVK